MCSNTYVLLCMVILESLNIPCMILSHIFAPVYSCNSYVGSSCSALVRSQVVDHKQGDLLQPYAETRVTSSQQTAARNVGVHYEVSPIPSVCTPGM